jgi:hypothetical protein
MGNWVTKTAFCLMVIGLALAVPTALYPSPQWERQETILLIGGGLTFFIGLFLLGRTRAIHK